jgi:hypothetical protein
MSGNGVIHTQVAAMREPPLPTTETLLKPSTTEATKIGVCPT